MERNLQRSEIQNELEEDFDLFEKCNSSTSEAQTNSSIGFECNICLDMVQDPVVTFCGHLYCWPCIYRWISFRHVSPENTDQREPQCPVCKAGVSQKTLIPLYGRGQKSSKDEATDIGFVIPQRPTSARSGNDTLMPAQHQLGNYPVVGVSGGTMHLADPIIGMLREMVCAGIFGNNTTQTTLYANPNSYRLAGNGSPRLRRHMMQADKSLSRICFFLCCCVVLCLLLF